MSVTFSLKGVRVDYESNEGWANFANANAKQIIDLLGIEVEDEQDLWGEIIDLAGVIRRAMRVLNDSVDHTVEGYEERKMRVQSDGVVTRMVPGVRVINCGTTDERVRDRVRDIMELCLLAQEEKTTVVFG